MPQRLLRIEILLALGSLSIGFKTGDADPFTGDRISKIEYTQLPDGIDFGVTYEGGNVLQVNHHGSYILMKSYSPR